MVDADCARHAGDVGIAASSSPSLLAVTNQHREQLERGRTTAPHIEQRSALPTQSTPVLVASQQIAFDRAQCLRFAIGGIAEVLGAEFADIDQHPTRVRLPDEPLMLVDRIIAIEGQAGELGPARITTEHDIHPDAWYLDGGRIPTCIAVEAGQADLFLSAWLGIDRVTQGNAVYRLLDANITFHDQMPGPGACIRYDIRINRFFTLGSTHLFQFEFDASVDGQPLLTMRDGSAGFFTAAELAAGQGIVDPKIRLAMLTGDATTNEHSSWLAPSLTDQEHYSDQQMDALRDGDLDACFGAEFSALAMHRAATLPSGRMRLVHRVLDIQAPHGAQPGRITGEADIHPHDWFLTCHFIDDQVMPGTLMYECCLHTLRIYLLRMGWVGEQGQVSYQSVPGYCGKLKCRGQVIASTRTVQYQISILKTDFLADGTPYAVANALMLADGHPIVEMQNMSLGLHGLKREHIEALWQSAPDAAAHSSQAAGLQAVEQTSAVALFDQASILAYAQGRPSDSFGDRYRIFDEGRILARLPRPPYLFMDEVDRIADCSQWQLAAGGEIESTHHIDQQAWYFAANRQHGMPLAILMEIALQPCGWLAAYLGSALTSDSDLSFRNLDGQATLHRALNANSGQVRAKTRINKVSSSGGMIIQTFSVTLHDAAGLLYQCETVFGFFSKAALAQQIGVRDAQWYAVENAIANPPSQLPYPVKAPFPDSQLCMLDELSVLSLTGGRHGLGWVEGHADVDTQAWYFQAHFYQDPVIPGSLGIESMAQLLKVYALERWSHLRNNEDPAAQFQCPAEGSEMSWSYRGQVVPSNARVSVQIHVARVDSATSTLYADGYLAVDGRIIYSVENLSLSLRGGT
jgi:3-hydroxymyristoyl/3-hydroxydecanoyl-(acyl carrier protein) dehydratase